MALAKTQNENEAEFDRALKRLEHLGFDLHEADGDIPGLACPDCKQVSVSIDSELKQFRCSNNECSRIKVPGEVAIAAGPRKIGPAQAMTDARREDIRPECEADIQSADRTSEQPIAPPGEIAPEIPAPTGVQQPIAVKSGENKTHEQVRVATPRSHLGEKIIIAFLALVFLGVGLLAAAMSGFANFQAFAGMVDDPFQSQIWGWTGIIACVCSFGGFTFAYWHGVARRFWEAGRAMLIALAGAATSLVGTQLYMQGEVQERAAAAQAAQARASLLEVQIEDWRGQLAGLPADIRSVEGLEAYIAEVERVGRTNERPYRMALDELGQARRRADLESRIEAARGELAEFRVASLGESRRNADDEIRHWFIAAMLEVFSSQGTSIGFVALMVLAGRKGAAHPAA